MSAVVDTPPEADATPAPRRHRWLRFVVIAVCALIAAMWVYAFLWAPDRGVYRVDDDNWRREAKVICEAARAERLKLVDTEAGYIANPTQEQMTQHADLVDSATDILDTMLDDLVAVPVPTARDRELIAAFEKYYRMIISDRRAYTAKLRTFELAPYQESSVNGGPVTNVVTDFTSGNDIKACVPPGELGTSS